MGLKVGICGAGLFSESFIPLFMAHPLVDEVRIAEVVEERSKVQAARFGVSTAYSSLEELCRSDVDAVVILTQRWMHARQAITALRAGKHVYSAVPAAVTLEELDELIDTVRSTGLTYMVGETSYYYPATLYCRQRYADGDFGRFVYGEGEYLHDMSHGFYEAYQHSGGDRWIETASFPPMLYPTHSVSMVLSVTGARMVEVSCFGFVDDHPDGVFRAEVSAWGNAFSNQTALFRTSDGGACRINEFRRVGLSGGTSVRASIYGTEGSYEEQTNARVWNTKKAEEMTDLSDLLTPRSEVPSSGAVSGDLPEALVGDMRSGVSAVHPVHRLPREFVGQPNGHEGSHQFLVVDFVEACVTGKTPPNNVWESARNCAPGIVAHESAKRGGELLKVPDFGPPPR